MTKLNEAQIRFLDHQMPYECKKCGTGSATGYSCDYCDAGVLQYAWRRGGIQTVLPAFTFGMFWYITNIHLFIAPMGLLLLWNFYLLITAPRRMRKHFKKRDLRRN